ncbi:hypothetical protein [Pseudomonas donghuensis]|uniref:hypothetical protein n=1 Tax=Pseudomonas donghuensis TaxID=1163398 RepID=UPI002160992D|nr:hypothetical protein [Pseudomonas donghuensis]UVL26202.1 hypothetical protein LOY30_09545 [Pseudomonas donghuensis]
MSSYCYKTTAPAVLEAVRTWEVTRKSFDAQRQKMADVFGGPGSPMRSGNDNYVGGVKISASKDLDVHWCRPDDHGYRSLRTSAKIPKGTDKEARAELKTEHERLRALWAKHCPARISMDETWKEIGLDWGSIWLSGGVFFELDGTVYLHLGFQLSTDGDQVEGATEIMSSELEAARQAVLNQRKAA